MVNKCGPLEVHFRVPAPPVTSPCYFGMDFPTPEELLINKFEGNKDLAAEWMGVKTLGYLSAEGLLEGTRRANPSPHGYCAACFTGDYPIPPPTETDKSAYDW